MNLTGLRFRMQIIKQLLLDSILPCRLLPETGRILDVGTGAGFPGIPLKICKPLLEAHFLEASAKKSSFLKQVVRLAALPKAEVITGRIERDKHLLNPEGYQIITTRALANLARTLTWCAPHLRPQGLLVNFQGSRIEEALGEAAAIMQSERLILERSMPYPLPGTNTKRHLLFFRKRLA